MKKIKTVVFDIGRVLNGYGWEKYLEGIVRDPEAYRAVEKAIFLNPAWAEHDKGFLSEEEEILDFASAAPGYEEEIRAVYENLGECTWIFDYAVPWVRELKEAGYRVYALSDWPKHIFDQRGNKLDFLELMDGYCLSFQEHLIKPSPEAFQNLIRRFGIKPDEAVFIDDTLANIRTAKELGFSTVHFQSYEQAREELKALGVG